MTLGEVSFQFQIQSHYNFILEATKKREKK